jgi:phospholipase C
MDRREFLRLGAMAAAAAALAQCSSDGSTKARPPAGSTTTTPAPRDESILDGAPGDSGIDTVVIAMMENRSFDSYLGWLSRDSHYLEQGRSRYGKQFAIDANSFQQFPGADGKPVKTTRRALTGGAHPWRGCGLEDPGHHWDEGRAERDGGFLAPASGNDELALSYFEGEDLPVYQQMARRFTVCDKWHASLLGPTYPNREYLLSGQSGGHKDNYLPLDEGGFDWPTIVDRLAAANVSTIEYYVDFPQLLLWGNRLVPHTRKMDPTLDAFQADAQAGKLPSVSIVTPAFIGANRTDDHPHGDPRAAQAFVRDAFAAFTKSKHWKNGLFILTYDEWGGFFDHVKPPILPDLRPSAIDDENFGQAGFRVPTVLASPYARPGFVDHAQYDHTSIMRFLEWRFLGAPARGPGTESAKWFLTPRDRHANNAGATLVRGKGDADVGFDVDLKLDAPEPGCVDETAYGDLPPNAMQVALESGYYERIGVRV